MKKILKLSILLLIITFVLSSCSLLSEKPKEFENEYFTITLTDAFKESSFQSVEYFYESNTRGVTLIRENGKGIVVDLTDYTNMVIEYNELSGTVYNGQTDSGMQFKYFYYHKVVEGKEYSYMGVTFTDGEDSYFLLNLFSETSKFEGFKQEFSDYVNSIVLK